MAVGCCFFLLLMTVVVVVVADTERLAIGHVAPAKIARALNATRGRCCSSVHVLAVVIVLQKRAVSPASLAIKKPSALTHS